MDVEQSSEDSANCKTKNHRKLKRELIKKGFYAVGFLI